MDVNEAQEREVRRFVHEQTIDDGRTDYLARVTDTAANAERISNTYTTAQPPRLQACA